MTATTAAAPAPALTRSGRPKVPALDTAAIEAAAEAEVHAVLDPITDPRAKLDAAARIEFEANGVIEARSKQVTNLALSLALIEGARSVNKAIGMSHTGFYMLTKEALGDWPERPIGWDETVAERAKKRRVRFYRFAWRDLPAMAAEVAAAKARIVAARPIRDGIVQDLIAQGSTRGEIAAIIDRDPSRVSHITGRGR